MQIILKEEFLKHIEDNIEHITFGALFIYPTDTLYGVGCDARKNSSVQRIRRIKNSFKNPLSVIVPSKEWIRENLVVEKAHEKWLDKLPGPYTLVFKMKVCDCVADDINPNGKTLGVRIPANWFADFVKEAGFPIVTTSMNVHGQKPFTSIEDVPNNFKMMVDFAVKDGNISGKASTLVDLTGPEPKVIERD